MKRDKLMCNALGLIPALIFCLALSGCGGGGSSDTNSSTNVSNTNSGLDPNSIDPAKQKANLFGTAATNIALSNATIIIHCGGEAPKIVNADIQGRWSTTVKPNSLPCMLRATGTDSQSNISFHSVATQTGVTNITPLTDAMIAIIGHVKPTAYFDTLIEGQAPGISSSDINNALTTLRGLLPSEVNLPVGVNPITAAFNVDSTDALWKVLGQIASVLSQNKMSWADAIDYVLSESMGYTDLFPLPSPVNNQPPARI